jgi:hypothetical protein
MSTKDIYIPTLTSSTSFIPSYTYNDRRKSISSNISYIRDLYANSLDCQIDIYRRVIDDEIKNCEYMHYLVCLNAAIVQDKRDLFWNVINRIANSSYDITKVINTPYRINKERVFLIQMSMIHGKFEFFTSLMGMGADLSTFDYNGYYITQYCGISKAEDTHGSFAIIKMLMDHNIYTKDTKVIDFYTRKECSLLEMAGLYNKSKLSSILECKM